MTGARAESSSLAFVYSVLFLDSVAVGLVTPVMPDFIASLTGYTNSQSAQVNGYLSLTFASMQFLVAPVLGAVSDRVGRRPILTLSLLGMSFTYFVMALAPSLPLLFAGRLVSGVVCGTYAAANACIVDVTEPQQRASRFGIANAAAGLGLILGPAIGGALGGYGVRAPFFVAGTAAAVICGYGFFGFKEPLRAERRRPFEARRANPVGSLLFVMRFPVTLTLLVATFLWNCAAQSYASIWSFFTKEMLGWSPLEIGVSAAVFGVAVAAVQSTLPGPFVRHFGEIRTVYFGLLCAMVTYIGLAFAASAPAIYGWIAVGGFGFLCLPSMQALMTRYVPESSQGELQGAVSSAFNLAVIAGAPTMSYLFGVFSRTDNFRFPGAPFIGSALLLGAALAIFSFGMRYTKPERGDVYI